MLTSTVTGHESDVSWNIFDLFVWAQVELQIGIMCASAPSLRVFFRRYLGGSSKSRAYNSGGRATPGLTNTAGSSFQPDKSITVVRSTSITFGHDQGDNSANKKPFEESLDTIGEAVSEDRASTLSKEHLTRYSHEYGRDSIPMQDMSWRIPNRSRWSGKV